MANTWNKAGTTWGYNSWQSDTVTISLTAPAGLTSSIGSVTAFNEQGWGSDTWGAENWGESAITASLTGVSATSSVGSLEAFNEAGWGRQQWGNSGWGVDYSVLLTGLGLTVSVGSAEVQLLVLPSGVSAATAVGSLTTAIVEPITAPSALTSSVGALTEVSTNAGWGRDSWGDEPWGDTDEPVVTLTGVSATTSIGTVSAFNEQGWGRDPWGYENWGESAMTVIVDATGLEATSSVGALSPTEMSIGLTGVYATTSVGTPGIVYGVDEALTGVSATASVGALSPTEMSIGLTGVSATGSTGALSPTEMSIGLIGVSATTSVGSGGVAPLHYKDVDITGNTSYTNKSVTGYTAYTDIEHSA